MISLQGEALTDLRIVLCHMGGKSPAFAVGLVAAPKLGGFLKATGAALVTH